MSGNKPVRACEACRNGDALGFDFSMAFQPIVDVETMQPFAYEALVRGQGGESAGSVLGRITPENRYAFDQRCRVKAIEMAVRAGILNTPAKLSINFLPNAVYSPEACIRLTLATAASVSFPLDRLMFEFTENEEIADPGHLETILATYRRIGFRTALDDFGAGHAGLNLLAAFLPDLIKLDMDLIRGIDGSRPRQIIVDGIAQICAELGVTVIAEGVETEGEVRALRDIGIRYMQGYAFARPAFEALPTIADIARRSAVSPA